MTLSLRSEAARRANATRRVNGVITALHAIDPFVSDGKRQVREAVADFLKPFGGITVDLHGPTGASAQLFARHGMKVIAAEDGRFLRGRALTPEQIRSALVSMAERANYQLYWGDVRDVLPEARTAFIDACGPYLKPTSDLVKRVSECRLAAFVVTVELSRLDGGRSKGEGHYLRWAEVGLLEDAPAYSIVKTMRYRGTANIPMAAFFLQIPVGLCHRADCDKPAARVFQDELFNGGRAWGLCDEHLARRQANERLLRMLDGAPPVFRLRHHLAVSQYINGAITREVEMELIDGVGLDLARFNARILVDEDECVICRHLVASHPRKRGLCFGCDELGSRIDVTNTDVPANLRLETCDARLYRQTLVLPNEEAA